MDNLPWDRAGVDRQSWNAARTKAAAILKTARLALDPDQRSESLTADHSRLWEYADRLVLAVEVGDPETVAMLLRRWPR